MAFVNSSIGDDMIDNDIDDGIYGPDFILRRKVPKASTGRNPYSYCSHIDGYICIDRPSAEFGMIPITEVDDFLNDTNITYKSEIPLNKHNMFNTIRDALELYSTRMVQNYKPEINGVIKTYTVPAIGFLKADKRDFSFGVGDEYATSIKHPRYYSPDSSSKNVEESDVARRERFIIIDRQTYSINKIYKRCGSNYIPLNTPDDYSINVNPIIDENEQSFRVEKQSVEKNIILTMPTEVELSGLSVHPESLQYESIHSTAIRCNDKCTKHKHCISCLKNNPGYLMLFKMYIRSSMTGGKWLLLGNFVGNNSIYDSHRISFDTIIVKQIKIEPISFHISFEKVRLFPIGPSISSKMQSDELFVTYTLCEPRDGKYIKSYDQINRKFINLTGRCDCNKCTGRKGIMKNKCRILHDACNDIVY
jgi:hypothetical protein